MEKLFSLSLTQTSFNRDIPESEEDDEKALGNFSLAFIHHHVFLFPVLY